MKVIGIIAEYNPFHKGHRHQIRYAKETLGADYVIAAISGPFTQRGTPAIFDKYQRAAMALSCGADLVLELPVCYATASAPYFADGGVRLLSATGVTNFLLFGCETPDKAAIMKTARLLSEEPGPFRRQLQHNIKQGDSFPKARQKALLSMGADYPLDSANNILAVEYARAILKQNGAMDFICHPRQGAAYHQQEIQTPFASAAAIRRHIYQTCTASEKNEKEENLYACLPEEIHQRIAALLNRQNFLHPDDISSMLHYKLLNLKQPQRYFDCSPALAGRLKKHQASFFTFTDFCRQMKTKEITYSRISRVLCHILLEITTSFVRDEAPREIPYLRVLGFRKASASLLTEIARRGAAPLVTSPSNALQQLTGSSLTMLLKDIEAAHIYRIAQITKMCRACNPPEEAAIKMVGQSCPTEYTQKLLVME